MLRLFLYVWIFCLHAATDAGHWTWLLEEQPGLYPAEPSLQPLLIRLPAHQELCYNQTWWCSPLILAFKRQRILHSKTLSKKQQTVETSLNNWLNLFRGSFRLTSRRSIHLLNAEIKSSVHLLPFPSQGVDQRTTVSFLTHPPFFLWDKISHCPETLIS